MPKKIYPELKARAWSRYQDGQIQPVTENVAVPSRVARVIIRELEDDYVGLWTVPWLIRRAVPCVSDEEMLEIAGKTVKELLAGGVALGSLDETTGYFSAWPPGDSLIDAMSAWRALGRDPNIGEVAWLARIP